MKTMDGIIKPGLTMAEKRTLQLIKSFYRKHQVYPTASGLARENGKDRGHFQKHITSLVKKGFLRQKESVEPRETVFVQKYKATFKRLIPIK